MLFLVDALNQGVGVLGDMVRFFLNMGANSYLGGGGKKQKKRICPFLFKKSWGGKG